jgi:hypothetical protein
VRIAARSSAYQPTREMPSFFISPLAFCEAHVAATGGGVGPPPGKLQEFQMAG